jgi:hypothetical protein
MDRNAEVFLHGLLITGQIWFALLASVAMLKLWRASWASCWLLCHIGLAVLHFEPDLLESGGDDRCLGVLCFVDRWFLYFQVGLATWLLLATKSGWKTRFRNFVLLTISIVPVIVTILSIVFDPQVYTAYSAVALLQVAAGIAGSSNIIRKRRSRRGSRETKSDVAKGFYGERSVRLYFVSGMIFVVFSLLLNLCEFVCFTEYGCSDTLSVLIHDASFAAGSIAVAVASALEVVFVQVNQHEQQQSLLEPKLVLTTEPLEIEHKKERKEEKQEGEEKKGPNSNECASVSECEMDVSYMYWPLVVLGIWNTSVTLGELEQYFLNSKGLRWARSSKRTVGLYRACLEDEPFHHKAKLLNDHASAMKAQFQLNSNDFSEALRAILRKRCSAITIGNQELLDSYFLAWEWSHAIVSAWHDLPNKYPGGLMSLSHERTENAHEPAKLRRAAARHLSTTAFHTKKANFVPQTTTTTTTTTTESTAVVAAAVLGGAHEGLSSLLPPWNSQRDLLEPHFYVRLITACAVTHGNGERKTQKKKKPQRATTMDSAIEMLNNGDGDGDCNAIKENESTQQQQQNDITERKTHSDPDTRIRSLFPQVSSVFTCSSKEPDTGSIGLALGGLTDVPALCAVELPIWRGRDQCRGVENLESYSNSVRTLEIQLSKERTFHEVSFQFGCKTSQWSIVALCRAVHTLLVINWNLALVLSTSGDSCVRVCGERVLRAFGNSECGRSTIETAAPLVGLLATVLRACSACTVAGATASETSAMLSRWISSDSDLVSDLEKLVFVPFQIVAKHLSGTCQRQVLAYVSRFCTADSQWPLSLLSEVNRAWCFYDQAELRLGTQTDSDNEPFSDWASAASIKSSNARKLRMRRITEDKASGWFFEMVQVSLHCWSLAVSGDPEPFRVADGWTAKLSKMSQISIYNNVVRYLGGFLMRRLGRVPLLVVFGVSDRGDATLEQSLRAIEQTGVLCPEEDGCGDGGGDGVCLSDDTIASDYGYGYSGRHNGVNNSNNNNDDPIVEDSHAHWNSDLKVAVLNDLLALYVCYFLELDTPNRIGRSMATASGNTPRVKGLVNFVAVSTLRSPSTTLEGHHHREWVYPLWSDANRWATAENRKRKQTLARAIVSADSGSDNDEDVRLVSKLSPHKKLSRSSLVERTNIELSVDPRDVV